MCGNKGTNHGFKTGLAIALRFYRYPLNASDSPQILAVTIVRFDTNNKPYFCYSIHKQEGEKEMDARISR